MKRRDFIRISGIGLGSLALAKPVMGLLPKLINGKGSPENGGSPDEKLPHYPTYCEVCFWKCAGWTYLDKNGDIKKVTGNLNDPHCNGRLCPRGTGGVGMYHDKDRLKTPLIRTAERGKQEFREASWDEALDYIAGKMKEIAVKYGPESMALFTHGSGGKYFSDIFKAYGSDSIASPSYAQCRGPRETAFITTFGESLDSPEPLDIRDTKCLVLIGSHLGENMHNGQIQEMSDAIDKGADIITVDPRFSTAAGKSKFWLPIKPGTDLALLLAWINVLIYENKYDKDYVEKYSYGFNELKAHVKDMTPEWAYGITTINPQLIRDSAEVMANASPRVIIHPGRHVTWYGDDTQRLRAMAILNALLGSWGRRGGYFFPTKAKLPSYEVPEFPKPAKTWTDALEGKYPMAEMPLANGIIDATLPDSKAPLIYKGWLVNGSNLISTMPDRERTIKAIQQLELLAVVDTMPMDICGWADVVLPECTYLERYDSIRTDHHREAWMALRMPAAKPKHESRPGWDIAKDLAGKLGLGAWFPFNTIEEEIDWKLKQVGSSLEEMKRIGVKKIENPNHKLFIAEGEDFEFPTNTGKIELYSTALEQEGFDPLPKYSAPMSPPEGYFHLIYGRAPMHTFSRTANNPNLTDLMEENSVWINPKVAANYELENGQYIYLKNQDGIITSFPVKVRITERIRWDSVYIVHGFGNDNKNLTRAFGKGASDAQLITRVLVDPIMGGTGMRGNFVTIITEKPDKNGRSV